MYNVFKPDYLERTGHATAYTEYHGINFSIEFEWEYYYQEPVLDKDPADCDPGIHEFNYWINAIEIDDEEDEENEKEVPYLLWQWFIDDIPESIFMEAANV